MRSLRLRGSQLLRKKAKSVIKKAIATKTKPKVAAKRVKYVYDNLIRAVDDYKNRRLNLRDAAELYEVPRSTISDYKTRKCSSNKLGRKTKLGIDIERILVTTCIRLSDIGLGLTKMDILAVVKSYCRKTNQNDLFPPSGPTDRFYYGFMARWKHLLSSRMANKLSVNRAKSVTKENAQKFYNMILNKKNELESEYGQPIPASNYWNADETGFCGSQGDTEIICRRG